MLKCPKGEAREGGRDAHVQIYPQKRTNTNVVTQMPSDWKLLAGNL